MKRGGEGRGGGEREEMKGGGKKGEEKNSLFSFPSLTSDYVRSGLFQTPSIFSKGKLSRDIHTHTHTHILSQKKFKEEKAKKRTRVTLSLFLTFGFEA